MDFLHNIFKMSDINVLQNLFSLPADYLENQIHLFA